MGQIVIVYPFELQAFCTEIYQQSNLHFVFPDKKQAFPFP
jgi:hypothetical protein